VTHKDTFLLPRIDNLLDQLKGKIFTSLDAKWGYSSNAFRALQCACYIPKIDAESADWHEQVL